VAILTGLLINARLLVYSASFAQYWSEQPRWFRLAAAGLIIDPTWAVAERHANSVSGLRQQRAFFLGAAITLGVVFSGAMALGAILGTRLDSLDLEIVIPLCLLALIGPSLRDGGTRVVVVVAAAVAMLTIHWPSGTGLLAAAVAGSVAGLGVDRRSER
jgi:predicted branched-subunit amino acid permease